MITAWVWLAASIACSAGGNILMKVASQRSGATLELLFSVPFVAGATIFMLGLGAYMKAIVSLPLSVAYPTVVGTSILIITTVSIWLFAEKVGAMQAVGASLIVLGLIFLTRGTAAT